MRNLLLMSTSGCHLCELAVDVIVQTLDPLRDSVEVVDIAEEEQYMERYAVRIPVLVDQRSGAELDWPFDAARLGDFIAALPPAAD